MEKELFDQCLYDTGLKSFIVGFLGEEAGQATMNRMFTEFNESVKAADEGIEVFSKLLAEKRALIMCVSDPDETDFYSECNKKLYSLQRNLKTYSRLSDAGTKGMGLLQIARDLTESCDLLSGKTGTGIPEGQLQTLSEFPQIHKAELTEIKRKLSYIQRELSSLPLIRLHFTSTNGDVSDCSLELTGKIPSRNNSSKAGIAQLPNELLAEMQSLRPELFNSIYDFLEEQEERLLELSGELSGNSQLLEYVLNLGKIIAVLRKNNFPLCQARISRKNTDLINACDVALILLRKNNLNRSVIPNNITLQKRDPITLLCGPSGSGKTSFLRTVAICHIFFMLGLPIPAAMGTMSPVRSIRMYMSGPPKEEIPGEELDGCLMLILWPEAPGTTDDDPAAVAGLLQEYSEKGARGIIAIRIQTGNPNVSLNGVPDNVPVLFAISDRDGKRTYKIKSVHRGEDPRASDIIARYGLDKSSLLLRFRTTSSDIRNGGAR